MKVIFTSGFVILAIGVVLAIVYPDTPTTQIWWGPIVGGLGLVIAVYGWWYSRGKARRLTKG
jgi:hypothetical protein